VNAATRTVIIQLREWSGRSSRVRSSDNRVNDGAWRRIFLLLQEEALSNSLLDNDVHQLTPEHSSHCSWKL